jgi:hypothetical protein
MTNQQTKTDATENALNAAQVLFTANPLFLAPQTKQTLQKQEQMFAAFEKFSSNWFKRRQEAVHLMIEAGRRIVSEGRADPTDMMKEVAEWHTGAIRRLAEDGTEAGTMLTQCARAVGSHEAEAINENADTLRKMPVASNFAKI